MKPLNFATWLLFLLLSFASGHAQERSSEFFGGQRSVHLSYNLMPGDQELLYFGHVGLSYALSEILGLGLDMDLGRTRLRTQTISKPFRWVSSSHRPPMAGSN